MYLNGLILILTYYIHYGIILKKLLGVLRYVKINWNGDIFSSECEYLVNPVNTMGVMGKGLALQFKEKFPENFNKYKKYCNSKDFTVGNY